MTRRLVRDHQLFFSWFANLLSTFQCGHAVMCLYEIALSLMVSLGKQVLNYLPFKDVKGPITTSPCSHSKLHELWL